MAFFRKLRRRKASATATWIQSRTRYLKRFSFPRLLRGDFWRNDAAQSLWQSLFGDRSKKKAEKRRRARRGNVSGWIRSPIGFQVEAAGAAADAQQHLLR